MTNKTRGRIPVTEPLRAVFLSYASQDAEAAQRICEALRAAGIEVWFDQSELRGGDVWDASIRKQIKICALFIPVISRNTHAREEGYFRLEWKLAVDRSHLIMANKVFLLPVVVDATGEDDENVPDKFREVPWTRLLAGETPPAFVERVQRLLSGVTSTTTRAGADESRHAVFLVEDPGDAESIARRPGATVVVPAGRMLPEAARDAVVLSDHGRILIMPRAGRPGDSDPGIFLSRAAVAITVAGGAPLVLSRQSCDCAAAVRRTLDPLCAVPVRLAGGRVVSPRSARLVDRLFRGLGLGVRHAIRLAIKLLVLQAVASGRPYGADRSLPSIAVARRICEDLGALTRVARARGIQLIAIGGLAIDLLAGRFTRVRKDMDLAILGGTVAEFDALGDTVEALGYVFTIRISGRYFRVARSGGPVIEIWRLRPADEGWFFETSLSSVWFPRSFAEPDPRILGPLAIRILRPALLLQWKLSQLEDVTSIFVRSTIQGKALVIWDVVTLLQLRKAEPAVFAGAGRLRAIRPEADLTASTREQLQRLLRRSRST